jgi:hypothetical protein
MAPGCLPKSFKKHFYLFLLLRYGYMCMNLVNASTCKYLRVLSESSKIIQKTFFFCFYKVWLLVCKFIECEYLQVLASIERVLSESPKIVFFCFRLFFRLGYMCVNLADASTCEYSQVLSESVKIFLKTCFFLFCFY